MSECGVLPGSVAFKLPPEIFDKVTLHVVRIEDILTGIGPYVGGKAKVRELLNEEGISFGSERSPSVWNEGEPGSIESHEVCGFHSMDKAKDWFSEPLIKKLVSDHGYVVNAYAVPISSAKLGNRQIVFKKDEAIFLYKVEI